MRQSLLKIAFCLVLGSSVLLGQATVKYRVDTLDSYLKNVISLLKPLRTLTIGSSNMSRLDSVKVRTDSLSFYVSGVPYNAYKNAPAGGAFSSVFDLDAWGNLMPVLTLLLDSYWEADENGDLMPKSEVP